MSNHSLMNPATLTNEINLLEKGTTPLERAQFNVEVANQYVLAMIETSTLSAEQIDLARRALLNSTEAMRTAVRQEKSFLKKLKQLREDRRWIIANKLPKFLTN